MDRPEGESLLGWLPEQGPPSNSGDPEYYITSRRSSDFVQWYVEDWWADQRVPGYSFRWRDLDRVGFQILYERNPELFFTPAIPIMRLLWWRFNSAYPHAWPSLQAIA